MIRSMAIGVSPEASMNEGTKVVRRYWYGLALVALIGLCWFLFFYRLEDRDLWSSHEARAAMNAQSLRDGALIPTLYDGRPDLQKPPLYYVLVAALSWCLECEVDTWTVRLPAALSALGCVLCLVLGLAWRGRPLAGLLAGLVLATTMHFTWLARIGRIDMPLALTVTVALLTLTVPRHFLWHLLGYVVLALGVLLKGPIALALVVTVLAALTGPRLLSPIREGSNTWRRVLFDLIRDHGLWWGPALVVALTVPLFLALDVATDGAFIPEFFGRHNLERSLGSGRLRSHPWWLYGPYFVQYFLPWTPVAAVALARPGVWRTDALARLGLAWCVGVVVLLSCVSFKRTDYLVPAWPGAALFLGCALADELRRACQRRVFLVCACVVLLAGGMIGAWLDRVERVLPAQESFRDYRAFAQEIRHRAPAPETVTFFRTEAHALAFRVGREMTVLTEYSHLNAWLQQGGRYVVMPLHCLDEVRKLPGVHWEEVIRNTELANGQHERPLVLVRGRITRSSVCAVTEKAD